MKFVNSFGFQVFSDDLSTIELREPAKVLATISPNSYGISTKDKSFQTALRNADYLVLDGVYFALASILINKTNIKRNQGPNVFNFFMDKLNREKGKAFFMGSTPEILEKIKANADIRHPNIRIEVHSPPFKPELSDQDNRIIYDKINAFEPDIVFVGMTCPKQEKWAEKSKSHLKTKMICSIGAVFDWYAGNEKSIHPIWWRLRLGWLKRTIDRPAILKRYPNVFIFFWHLFLVVLRLKKIK